MKNNARVVDLHFAFGLGLNHLMSVSGDLYPERAKLDKEFLDLLLSRIAAHVAQVFILSSGQDLVDHSCKLVGDGYLGLIFGA